MANPRIYFNLKPVANVFVPYRRMNRDLDKLFAMSSVLNANSENYNEYTRRFIAEHKDKSEVYMSTAYDWDAETHTFNFHDINVVADSEIEQMLSYVLTFDVSKDYNYVPVTFNTPAKENVPTLEGIREDLEIPAGTNIIDYIADKFPCPTLESGFYVENKNWNFLIRNILRKKNTMLIGPTGAGKTEIVMKICQLLGIECNVYDMGSMQDPLTDLLGSHRLQNGSSTFDYAKFVYDVQKPGVILLDELSRAPLMANNILFPCLDSRRMLPVEIADSKSDRQIKVHPQCVFIATANIGAEYSGTQEIDAALMNRFLPLQLDYLPESIEQKVLMNRTGISESDVIRIVNFANIVRAEAAQGNLSKSVSTRETIAVAEMVVDGFTILQALEFIICQKYLDNSFSSELSYVKKLIMGM